MNQLAMSVASNNIANAQSPEYARQRLVVSPAGPTGGALLIGGGVDVVRVQALRDQFIDRRLQQETSARSGDETLTRALSDVEVLFNDSEDTGLLLSLTKFFNSFHTLSLDPASMNFREELKINANALIDSFRSRYNELTNIQRIANDSIEADVGQVNALIRQIASVTDQIKTQETQHVSNDLRDQRTALVRRLSEFVEVSEVESGNGDYRLSTANNQLLVLNSTTFDLADEDITAGLGDGSLKANLNVRDVHIPGYLTQLDQLAYEITEQVNLVHAASYNLDGETGINFFTSLTSASDASRLIALSTGVNADVRKIAASELSTGNDNRAATRLGNLLHTTAFTGGTVTDQYQTLVFTVGTDLANAELNLREHKAIEHQLENRRASVSGVSIEEETVQILQFQRAFEASARMIRTVDEMIQVLLGMGVR